MTKKVVIFEDDAFLMDAYKLKLSTDPEWSVVSAVDGDNALSLIKSEKPDIIILDILMPKISGLDVLKNIKADAETRSIPVIIASNIDQDSTVKQAIALGAQDYFIKSEATITDLLGKCKKVLGE